MLKQATNTKLLTYKNYIKGKLSQDYCAKKADNYAIIFYCRALVNNSPQFSAATTVIYCGNFYGNQS